MNKINLSKKILTVSLATILVSVMLVSMSVDVVSAKTGECAKEVPFRWSFTKTGDSVASVYVENNGPAFSTEGDTDDFSGSFKIKRDFTPPGDGWVLAPGETIPTSTSFTVGADLSGTYADTTLNIHIGGVGFVTYVKVNGDVTCLDLGDFTPINKGTGSGPFSQTKSSSPKIVQDNEIIPFNGNVNVDTLFGFGGQDLDFINVFAQVFVTPQIDAQQRNIQYYKPDGTLCNDDGDPCTIDKCKDGECTHTLKECPDGTRCCPSGEFAGQCCECCSDADCPEDEPDCEDGECVPEFSTIAIPVVTMLGLVFLISRRRQKRR